MTIHCKCNDKTHDSLGTTAWHRAYCNWYDARAASQRIRAALWGKVADLLVPFATTG